MLPKSEGNRGSQWGLPLALKQPNNLTVSHTKYLPYKILATKVKVSRPLVKTCVSSPVACKLYLFSPTILSQQYLFPHWNDLRLKNMS